MPAKIKINILDFVFIACINSIINILYELYTCDTNTLCEIKTIVNKRLNAYIRIILRDRMGYTVLNMNNDDMELANDKQLQDYITTILLYINLPINYAYNVDSHTVNDNVHIIISRKGE